MKIHKIILALNEQIFLEWCKILGITNIKTNEDIIIWEKDITVEWSDETSLTIIHWKDPQKVTQYISSNFIHVEKLIISNGSKIVSNWELQTSDIIIPNTCIWEKDATIFLEETVWNDYDLNNFWLILNWISTSVNPEKINNDNNEDEFIADVYSENIFSYLKLIEWDDKITQSIVILQIWGEDSYKNLISICDMTL